MNIRSLAKTAFTGLAALVMTCTPSDSSYKRNNSYSMKDSNMAKGIYECTLAKERYQFNSEDPANSFQWNTPEKGIRFNDLLTGNSIELSEGQDYSCNPINDESKNDRNWVSVNVWDSFYPLMMEKTIPESLMALEVIFRQYYKYNAIRGIKEMFGANDKPLYGRRARESHFMMWMHLSDDFLKKHYMDSTKLAEELFMFPERETDLFVGWGGEANLPEFISKGVGGLADTLHNGDGTPTGSFHGFKKAVESGDPEFEGGFFISDEQALKILESFETYPGLKDGYSFLSKIEAKPNASFEPKLSQGVNGNNCGDFVYYALTTAGIINRGEAEKAKLPLWYAEEFWDNPVPLDIYEILTGTGLFDEKTLASHILQKTPEYKGVRIWEPASSIKLLEKKASFRSKRVIEELLPAVLLRSRITTPFPNGEDRYRFRETEDYRQYLSEGNEMMREKLEKAGLTGESLDDLRLLEDRLKRRFNESMR